MSAYTGLAADEGDEPARVPARPARVRLPLAALIVPAALLFWVLPLATAGRFWAAAYLLPLAVLVLVTTAGTVATAQHLSTRWWTGRRRLAWEQVDRIEFPGARWAVAVSHAGERLVLPGVRPRDLPRIVAASGGRLFLRRPVPEGRGTSASNDDDARADDDVRDDAAPENGAAPEGSASGSGRVADGTVMGGEPAPTGGAHRARVETDGA